jgi:hypothetical protein
MTNVRAMTTPKRTANRTERKRKRRRRRIVSSDVAAGPEPATTSGGGDPRPVLGRLIIDPHPARYRVGASAIQRQAFC